VCVKLRVPKKRKKKKRGGKRHLWDFLFLEEEEDKKEEEEEFWENFSRGVHHTPPLVSAMVLNLILIIRNTRRRII